MFNLYLYGALSVLPLVIGSFIGSAYKISVKFIGFISALGAGALIAAATFGLMEESFKVGGLDNSILGFVIGGILFIVGDLIIIKIGGRGHRRFYDTDNSTGWGIVLGAVLDGIPESIALGLGLILNPSIGLLVLVAILANNLPEAISSAYDLRRVKKSFREIMLTWTIVALVAFVFVILGYTIFAGLSANMVATLQSLAAGSIIAMLASTMMPEAYRESGINASLATVLGFLAIFILAKAGV